MKLNFKKKSDCLSDIKPSTPLLLENRNSQTLQLDRWTNHQNLRLTLLTPEKLTGYLFYYIVEFLFSLRIRQEDLFNLENIGSCCILKDVKWTKGMTKNCCEVSSEQNSKEMKNCRWRTTGNITIQSPNNIRSKTVTGTQQGKRKWERQDSSWKKEKGSEVDILEWDDEPQQRKERGGGSYESQSFE